MIKFLTMQADGARVIGSTTPVDIAAILENLQEFCRCEKFTEQMALVFLCDSLAIVPEARQESN